MDFNRFKGMFTIILYMKKHYQISILILTKNQFYDRYKQNKILDLRVIKPKQTEDHTALNQFLHENKSRSIGDGLHICW